MWLELVVADVFICGSAPWFVSLYDLAIVCGFPNWLVGGFTLVYEAR